MAPKNLLQMLQAAAEMGVNKGLVFEDGDLVAVSGKCLISYSTLFKKSLARGHALSSSGALNGNPIVLLHTVDHEDSISWFWAIVAAGGVPCISTQIYDLTERKSHFLSLQKLLGNPLVVTTKTLINQFSGIPNIRLFTTEPIDAHLQPLPNEQSRGFMKASSDLAVLMLTFGNAAGDTKAVCITHEQILASLDAKVEVHLTTSKDIFLNWNPLDHVVNIFDTHLHAVRVVASQIHVPQSLLLTPLKLLDKLSYYKASYTFAPNFLIWGICQELETVAEIEQKKGDPSKLYDLSCLRAFVSGGEVNITETCLRFTQLLQKFGAPKSFLRPELGITETCGGALYNLNCPTYDARNGKTWCSVGYPTSAVNVRVVAEGGGAVEENETGHLELSGPAVFSKYFNDIAGTVAAFTGDGWYKTGDMGYFDKNGALYVTGRHNASIYTNGVKLSPVAIENAVFSARVQGIMSTHLIAFPHRPAGFDLDVICIVYNPIFNAAVDTNLRLKTSAAISRAVIKFCGIRPYKVIPIEEHHLRRTAIGKLSRSKTRLAFEAGIYASCEAPDLTIANTIKRQFRPDIKTVEGMTRFEHTILGMFLDTFPLGSAMLSLQPTSKLVDPTTSIFNLGLTFIEVMKFKAALQRRLNMPEFSVSKLFGNATLRKLANLLSTGDYGYAPVITLRSEGGKTPLWCVHDEMGDVYSFMSLARLITDRPIHVLQPRGHSTKERPFPNLPTLLKTYYNALTTAQPNGPYAFLGLSKGSVIAYELAKELTNAGEEVQFLGLIDPPPPPSTSDQQEEEEHGEGEGDYFHALCGIATSFGLITKEKAKEVLVRVHPPIRDSEALCLDEVVGDASLTLMGMMGLDKKGLDRWARMSVSVQGMIGGWEVKGEVEGMDVFTMTNGDEGDGKGELDRWREFVEGDGEECRFWGCGEKGLLGVAGGDVEAETGREVLGPLAVRSFWKVLGEAMRMRGL